MHCRIVMLGPPAAGKGTQADLLRGQFGFETPSVGAMLREEAAAGTPLGVQAASFFDRGLLVPDELSIAVVDQWLRSAGAGPWAIDGFPRTVAQAEALDQILTAQGASLDFALLLRADEATIRERILNRLVCMDCGGTWRRGVDAADAGAPCPQCGHALSRRKDDTLETLHGRLAEYHAKTAPVISYYEERGMLQVVDGARPVMEVFADISSALTPV